MVKFQLNCECERNFLFLFLFVQYDLVGEVDRTGDRDPKKRAATIMEQLDVNGNKKLNKAEFIAGFVFFQQELKLL